MVRKAERISLWSEGLDKHWVADPDDRHRLARGHLEIDQLLPLIETIRFKNDGDPEGILILQSGEKRLHIKVLDAALLLSDPQNPNYQNVGIQEGELNGFIAHYFDIGEQEAEHEWTNLRILNFIVLSLALAGVAGALYFLVTRVSFTTGFYPTPTTEEIGNQKEFNRFRETYRGIYATGVWDGALVIELTPDLEFHYYDMKRSSPGQYILQSVIKSTYRPVNELGSPAILAGERILIHPVKEDLLEFENRHYERLGTTRPDVPFLAFPE